MDSYESFISSDVFGSNSDSDCEDGSFDFNDSIINRKRQSSSPIQENEGLPPDDSPPKRKKSEEKVSADLMQPIKEGNFNEVQKILQENPQLANLSRKDPLHVAIRLCHIPIVRLLLLNGFNVDAPDYRGVTPIQLAVEKEQKDIVQLLLAHGANCNIRNIRYGLGIIHTVVRQANPKKPVPSGIPYGGFDMLTKEQAKLVNKEIFDKNYQILEVLLNSSLIDINLTSSDGKTALYYAVVGTNYEFATSLVKLLLSKDADTNVQSKYGKTALSRAMTLCRAEIIEQLLIKGASTEELINRGQMSPIAWGIARGRVDITELLLKYSTFNVNTNDEKFCAHQPSLLHYSLSKGNSNVMRCLINAGASIVHCEKSGTKVSPFLHCSDDLSTQAEQCRKLLMEHLVLLQHQKLYKFSKEEKSYIFSNFQLELHFRKLQNELVALKKMKIPQTDFTFYDFATSTDHDAAQLIEIPAIDKYCAQKALSILYPGFCKLMCDRNKAGQARLELLCRQNSIENVKKYFSSNYDVKSSFMDKIMSRLNNRDLKHLLDAYDKL